MERFDGGLIMEPKLPVDALMNLLGLTPEKLNAIDQNVDNKLISSTAVSLFGNPKMKEAASFYNNRYPQILNALAEPGVRNKVNAVTAALANEGTNLLTDAAVNDGLPYLAGTTAARFNLALGPPVYAGAKAIAPYVGLVKDAVQSDQLDPHVYDWMKQLNVGGRMPTLEDLTGLITKNPTARSVMTTVARNAVNTADANISGWAQDQLSKHPTPQIIDPLREEWTSKKPKEKAKSSDLRQVVKPISDAVKGKTSLQTGLQQAVRGYFNPELMRAIEDGVRAANKISKEDYPAYGPTALSGNNGKYKKK